jgi:pimeloyl-ACP methyl ester carboxylesterase
MAHLDVADGRRVYYEHYPAGRTTVVLVHGWGMSCRAWDTTLARLQDARIGVVTYDQRGCGHSDKDFVDMSIEAHGADLATLCHRLSLESIVLNGWSLGGAIAVDAATRLGTRVAGLVLTCGATPRYTHAADFPHGGSAADVAATVAALRANRVEFLKGLYYTGVFARSVSDDVKHWCWQIALQASPSADASLAALANLDQRALMARIDAPALVVIGARDAVVDPDIERAASRHLPNARALELAECGHAPFLEDPAQYHDALLDFLRDIGAAGP